MRGKDKTLDLSNKNISDPTKQVSKNTKIKVLNLFKNNISVFPPSLPKLVELNVGCNNMSNITEKMANALLSYKKLEKLDLSDNDFFEFPDILSNMKNLKDINLFGNHISKISFQNTNLKVINMGHNFMTDIPPLPNSVVEFTFDFNMLTNLNLVAPKLEVLSLELVGLETINPSLKFPHLVKLNLARNNLKIIPDLKNFAPKLKILNISDNFFNSFVMPPSKIEEYNIRGNNLTSIPDSISSFKCLRVLNVSNNKITHIPQLPESLEVFHFHENEIKSIANSNLPKLTQSYIRCNPLENFPPFSENQVKDVSAKHCKIKNFDIRNLSNTAINIDLSFNILESIPNEISSLRALQKLNLAYNQIKTVSPSIGSIKMLKVLNLTSNKVKELPKLPPTLEELYIGSCGIDDLTTPLSTAKNLTSLIAPNNSIKSLPQLNLLRYLNISRNQLEEFPNVATKYIILFDVSYNNIREFPEIEFPRAEEIDVSGNKLVDFTLDVHTLMPKIQLLKLNDNPLKGKYDKDNFKGIDMLDISKTKIVFKEEPEVNQMFVSERKKQYVSKSIYEVSFLPWMGYSETKGVRKTMEDSIILKTRIAKNIDVYGVFDGHGGTKSSRYGSYFAGNAFISKYATFNTTFVELIFQKLADELRMQSYNDGTTMAFAAFNGEKAIIAHLGDARLIVIDKDGNVKFSTQDHKPFYRREFERIHLNGGRVVNDRIHGLLAPARTFGDEAIQGNSNEPEINEIDIGKNDKWIIVGCDGLFDVLPNDVIGTLSKEAESADKFTNLLRNLALSLQSDDNITVLAIDISKRPVIGNEEKMSTEPPKKKLFRPETRLSLSYEQVKESLLHLQADEEDHTIHRNRSNHSFILSPSKDDMGSSKPQKNQSPRTGSPKPPLPPPKKK